MKLKIFIYFLVFSISAIHSQDYGEQYLKALQTKFNSIQDFTADINQFINGKSAISGKLFFKKANNFRAEFENTLLISDGVTAWNHNKKENKVIITDYEEDESLFSINFLIYQFPSQSDLYGEQEGNFRKLVLTPKSKSSNLGQVTLWINNNDLIEKINTNDPASGLIEINFKNIKINQNLPSSNFQYIPPQGSRIIDLR